MDLVDIARWQFGITTVYHFLFVPITIGLATTTVLTVLSRLERKGFVSRSRDMRPHRYRALLSREEHTAELMHEVLDRSADRDAALARVVGTASAGEAATLRRLLDELARH